MKKLIALLAALALLAAACGSDSDSADDGSGADDSVSTDDGTTTTTEAAPATEAGQGGELTLLQWQAPSQANNLLSSGTKDLLAGSIVIEPLAELSPAGDLVPTLATEIPTKENGGVSEDGTQITWTLRDDVLWSDGTPLTAEDVVFSYEYCADTETGCANQAFTGVETVVDNGDNTITITFSEPTPYPYQPYVGYQSPIIQKAQMADCIGAEAKACSEQNFAPIGTGPYMVVELRPEDTVTYEFNPNYRFASEGKPFFSTVTIKGGGSAEDSARSVLEVGDADYAWNLQVAPEILANMEAAGIGRLVGGFASSVEHISLNQTDPEADPPSEGTPHPLFVDNPDLHRALSISINRDELVTVGYGPAGNPTCNIWPVNAYGELSTNNDWCLTQNIDEANALLDGLGYEDTDNDGVREAPGFGPLEFDYITSTNAVRQSNQELIQAYWAEIGVKANMKNADGGLFFDGTCASDDCIWKFFNPIQMYTNSSSTGPYGAGYVNSFTSDKIPTSATNWGGDNIYRINSPEIDALELELRTLEVTDPRYAEIMIEINDIAVNSAIIPLIHRADATAISNTIQGLGDLNGWDSEYWNIEEWFRSE
ncbi:MAG: peptide ABC transporter substrate-binding protein [Acidimicrobiales bacterium]|nr:peptide ABC transporter substrate-binding protein [Acidimicrobiales bacterium]